MMNHCIYAVIFTGERSTSIEDGLPFGKEPYKEAGTPRQCMNCPKHCRVLGEK